MNYCFICGLHRYVFERASTNNKGFQFHLERDHSMWNYIFYLAYIRSKKVTEYTGIESYVA